MTTDGTLEEQPDGHLDARLRLRLGAFSLDVDLAASPGSVVAVLGPNGAGKSTILRCLAGLAAIDEGHVRLGDRILDAPDDRTFVAPEHRRVGLVHQDLLLFPHLDVLENVAFGPRSTGTPRAVARARAREQIAAVGLTEHLHARPRELSGGQAQRVALARALVADPDLLLLDEPLSALDVTTRTSTRRDLRHHLRAFAGIALVISHDPLDALVLADEVLVIEEGRVTQGGPVADLAARPRSRYVADLVGVNLLTGRADGTEVHLEGSDVVVAVADPAQGDVFATIDPGAVALHRHRPEGSPRNVWAGSVTTIDLLGSRVRVGVDGDLALTVDITPAALSSLGLQPGDHVWCSVKATEVRTHPR